LLFSPALSKDLIREFDLNYLPTIISILGPARANNVKIFYDHTMIGDAGYSPSFNFIHTYVNDVSGINVLVHEVTHAHEGQYNNYFSSVFAEGLAVTVTEYIFDFSKADVATMNRAISTFRNNENLNNPKITYNNYSSLYRLNKLNYSPLASDYEWGPLLMTKLYIEDKNNLKNFIAAFTQNIDALSSSEKDKFSNSDGLGLSMALKAIKQAKSTIEGVETDLWLKNQFYLIPTESNNIGGSLNNTSDTLYLVGSQDLEFDRPMYGTVYGDDKLDKAYLYSPNLNFSNTENWEFRYLNWNNNYDSFKIELSGKNNGSEISFGIKNGSMGELNFDQIRRQFKPIVFTKNDFNVLDNYEGLVKAKITMLGQGQNEVSYDQYFFTSNRISPITVLAPNIADGVIVRLDAETLDACNQTCVSCCKKFDSSSGSISLTTMVQNGVAEFNSPELLQAGRYKIIIQNKTTVCSAFACEKKTKIIEKIFNKINYPYVSLISDTNDNFCFTPSVVNNQLKFINKSTCLNEPAVIVETTTNNTIQKCNLGDACVFDSRIEGFDLSKYKASFFLSTLLLQR